MVPNFRIQLHISSSSCYYYEEPHPAPAGFLLALTGRQSTFIHPPRRIPQLPSFARSLSSPSVERFWLCGWCARGVHGGGFFCFWGCVCVFLLERNEIALCGGRRIVSWLWKRLLFCKFCCSWISERERGLGYWGGGGGRRRRRWWREKKQRARGATWATRTTKERTGRSLVSSPVDPQPICHLHLQSRPVG